MADMIRMFFSGFLASVPLLLVFVPPLIVLAVILLIAKARYEKTTYYKITKTPYFSLRRDVGKYGEYMIYDRLKEYEQAGGKFLFNVYIPKEEGETTEIDVLLLCKKGVFVFESKNYSGWIFGNEFQKNWTQSLPQGRGKSLKEHFYNPIMQNRTHIKHLQNLIGDHAPIHSVIVFSERCTLKDVTIKSDDIKVINRYDIAPAVSGICETIVTDPLTEEEIARLYDLLYPLSQVSDQVKAQHIKTIHENLNPTDPQQDLVFHCPKCGGDLVLRTAKRGQNAGNTFYGCSNFPKCKYVQKPEESSLLH